MALDLEKLTPGKWGMCPYTDGPSGELRECVNGNGVLVAQELDPATCNAEFIALAKNAFDVMMRRGWSAYRLERGPDVGKWCVTFKDVDMVDQDGGIVAADPFTALVEADKWCKENVECSPSK